MADFPLQTIPWGLEAGVPDEPGAQEVRWNVYFVVQGGGSVIPTILLTFIDPIPPNLPSPGRALLFDVTGADARGVTLVAEYNTGAYEVIHDGSEFAQVYAAASVRTVIQNGYQFLVRRAGGWFGDSVTIRTIAAAANG